MNVLVVGGGGREHALCWKLGGSPSVDKVYCAPGNAGIEADAECVDIGVDQHRELADFAGKNDVGLTVVGPEAPLCSGIVDVFRGRGLRVFGPSKRAARLEGSKTFSKTFMERYQIPTAEGRSFMDEESALRYLGESFDHFEHGLVVKADGLAAGKGVVVASSLDEAEAAVKICFSGGFGSAGSRVVVEERLEGEEASILAMTDGNVMVPLASSQDHKRLLDGDRGPNTGGMGAYSPAPVIDEDMSRLVGERVLANFLRGAQEEELDYRGIIYAGIMVTSDGPKVLEFNVRFGDPETQAVLFRFEGDLGEAMLKTADQELDSAELDWNSNPAVCVVMASGGYPLSYEKGYPISGLEDAEATGAKVFHAGTRRDDGQIVNAGGRVLGVTASGDDVAEAIANAYLAVDKISWKDAVCRRDIGHRAVKR